MSRLSRPALLPLAFGLLAAGFLAACGLGGPRAAQGPGAQTTEPAPGALALIRADPHPRLVLEIDATEGFEPYPENGARLAERLADLLDKPGGIEATLHGTLPTRGSDHAWTFAELDALARQTEDLVLPAGTARIHVLFVDGRYAGPQGSSVIGLAWAHRNIVVFKEVLERACAAATLDGLARERVCADSELAVWIHEVGHLVGLVDNGLVMQSDHEDDEHPGHDRRSDCVMYWAYEGDAAVQRVVDDLLGTGNAALDFCEPCRADVAAVR